MNNEEDMTLTKRFAPFRLVAAVVLTAALITGFVSSADPASATSVGFNYAYWVQASGNADLFNCGVGEVGFNNAGGNAYVSGYTYRKYGPNCALTKVAYDQSESISMQPVYYNQGNGPYACPYAGGFGLTADSSGSNQPYAHVYYTNFPDWSGAASPCRNGYGAYMHGYTFQIISAHKVQVAVDGWVDHGAILATSGLGF